MFLSNVLNVLQIKHKKNKSLFIQLNILFPYLFCEFHNNLLTISYLFLFLFNLNLYLITYYLELQSNYLCKRYLLIFMIINLYYYYSKHYYLSFCFKNRYFINIVVIVFNFLKNRHIKTIKLRKK